MSFSTVTQLLLSVLPSCIFLLHNEELSDLYSLPNVVQVVKSRRMRWVGHVARMGGGERCAQVSGWQT